MMTRSTIVLLLLPVALAAAPARADTGGCATLETKVQAKLDRGLAACGRLDVRKTSACEEAKWTKYDVRLAKAGCPIPQREPSAAAASVSGRHIRRPVAVAIRARDGRPGDLAAADRAVLDAFDDYVVVLRRLEKARRAARASADPAAFRVLTKEFVPIVRDALARLRGAEDALASVEQSVWGSYPVRWRLDAVIDQPLGAAMQQLQIELRRLLSPVFATEVPGLREMPGCRGDLIHDRLIAAFGDAMLIR